MSNIDSILKTLSSLSSEQKRELVQRLAGDGMTSTLASLHARSFDFPTDPHLNRMPFSGVLTKIDQPSDGAPSGSHGKRITLTKRAAQAALDSLLGMAVNFTPEMDGHDPQAKIGLITSAEIDGQDLLIKGFFYAADFPEVAANIKANKEALGFSFEARDLITNDPDADPISIVDCVFTGAAILFKDKAAYKTTSLN
jgi:hypothetical protein